jgi:LysM repeat protein
VPPGEWRRYAGPAAFLLVVTVAVILIRSGVESGHHRAVRHTVVPPPPSTHVDTAARTTTVAKLKAQAKRYWTVQAGDTFGRISAATGVPVSTIEQLNPGISSTSLTIGEKVRIR